MFSLASVSLLVSSITQNYYSTDFHKNRWKCGAWAMQETVRFWW